MEQGGNRKLQEFLAEYALTDVIDIKVKYNTRAVDFYRRRNLARAQNLPFDESPPEVYIGRTLLDGRRLDVNGLPVELTEEEREALNPSEKELLDHAQIIEESRSGSN